MEIKKTSKSLSMIKNKMNMVKSKRNPKKALRRKRTRRRLTSHSSWYRKTKLSKRTRETTEMRWAKETMPRKRKIVIMKTYHRSKNLKSMIRNNEIVNSQMNKMMCKKSMEVSRKS